MKKLITIIIIGLCCFSCSTIKYVPIKGDTVVEYRDTTIYKDSIVYTPKEVVKEIVPELDTLSMETSLAKATAYLDTTNRMLRGKIENKKGITEQIKYKEKIVYRDSVVTQEIPVEVIKEVKVHFWYEKLLWILSLGFVSILIYKGIQLYKKYIVHAAG